MCGGPQFILLTRLRNIFLLLVLFFFYVGFLSRTFTNHRTTGEKGGHFINFQLPFPPASQTLRHYPGDYCRKLTSAHRNREPLVPERKSLTTKVITSNKQIKPHYSQILILWMLKVFSSEYNFSCSHYFFLG